MSQHPHLLWFKVMLSNKYFVERLKNVSLVITDVDGSLTDGTVHFDHTGEANREYSPQDGYAIRMAMENGIKVAFLSGNAGASIASRARKLKVPENMIVLGSHDKRSAVKQLQTLSGVTNMQTLIFGDDYLDAAVKESEPDILFAMPNNGIFYLQPLADCVTPAKAGPESALRLLLDLLLFVQNKHTAQHFIHQALDLADEKNNTFFAAYASQL